MAEDRSNQAICSALFLAPKTVEAHMANIFSKLELPPAPDDHHRVLAVFAHLREPG
jgi:DNA-binding NarL/FixJ family response regulator